MKLFDHPLLADEKIDPDVVAALRARGHDVMAVREAGLGGAADRDVLRAAHRTGRVVLTHDADFGPLAIRDGEPFVGVVFVRPGHVSATVVLSVLDSVETVKADLDPPFVVVAERRGNETRIRARAVDQVDDSARGKSPA